MRYFCDILLINNDVVDNKIDNELFSIEIDNNNVLFLIKIDNDKTFDFLIDNNEIVFNVLIFSNVDE